MACKELGKPLLYTAVTDRHPRSQSNYPSSPCLHSTNPLSVEEQPLACLGFKASLEAALRPVGGCWATILETKYFCHPQSEGQGVGLRRRKIPLAQSSLPFPS